MDDEYMDRADFDRDFQFDLLEKAKRGDVESAWHLIDIHVAWADEHERSAFDDYFLGFFGPLIEMKRACSPQNPSPKQLTKALTNLHISHGRGRPRTKADEITKSLAGEEFDRRPKSDGGSGMGADQAREVRMVQGKSILQQRDIRTSNRVIVDALQLAETAELSDIAHYKPDPKKGD